MRKKTKVTKKKTRTIKTPKKQTVYYAHCQAIYNTPQEVRDICLLSDLGFIVHNPASLQGTYSQWLDDNEDALKANEITAMDFWVDKMMDCDVVAFRALPDGRIPLGIWTEVMHAKSLDRPVFELPSNVSGRSIGLAETREYLKEIGQR